MTDTSKLTTENVVEFIADLYRRRGSDWYMGEPVTIAQHMLQAAYFAEKAGADEELIVSALLHDIGHYTSEFPEDCLQEGIDNQHEDAGAEFLKPFFSARVVDPVRLHVATKRYLCATHPSYYDVLSDASKQSLEVQGGPMNDDEVSTFEAEANYKDAIRVRHWDEAGKEPDLDIPDFDHYIPMMNRLVLSH